MREPIQRLTLLVPGSPASLAGWREGLRGTGFSLGEDALLQGPTESTAFGVEWIPNDGEFGAAFGFGTVPPEGVSRIDSAPGALLLTSTEDLREGRLELLAALRALQAAGALAMRIEESKAGWLIERWIEILSDESPYEWQNAVVAYLWGETELQTCGMHAFSLPDLYVEFDAEGTPEEDRSELTQLASILNSYQVGEDPLLFSGHTFSPDAETPRRVLERWPDTNYPGGHACHNPYGVWRLGPPGGVARLGPDLVPVFVPALIVLLEGRGPMTRAEVEAFRDMAPCVSMEPRHARDLERSRGYADLNPEFLWEQWELTRGPRD